MYATYEDVAMGQSAQNRWIIYLRDLCTENRIINTYTGLLCMYAIGKPLLGDESALPRRLSSTMRGPLRFVR